MIERKTTWILWEPDTWPIERSPLPPSFEGYFFFNSKLVLTVYVQRVALHYRVCEHKPGPAIEGMEWYKTVEEAQAAAEEWLAAEWVEQRLKQMAAANV